MKQSSFTIPLIGTPSRRIFLRQIALATTFFTVRGAFAQELARKTPRVEEGPFYPPKLPLDTDNDLIIVNDSITPAVGDVTHLTGRLLDTKGDPIRNATIEIWSVDGMATYLAERSGQAKFDAHFQGFGRFLTGSTGEYYFRTLKPVRYPGREAPHVHFKIKRKGFADWTTQLFIKGHPGNERDNLWQGIRDEQARALVTKEFAPVKDSRIGELAASFDMVLGATPEDVEPADNARGRGPRRGPPPGPGADPMKNKLPIYFFLILTLFVVLSAFLGRSKSADQIAVADAYVQLSGFLSGSNHQAYEMMSAEFRKTHDITAFESEIEKSMARSFKECDLARERDVRVSGTQANLGIKYTADLGRTFFFVKEGGQWKFTGKTVDYKTSLQ